MGRGLPFGKGLFKILDGEHIHAGHLHLHRLLPLGHSSGGAGGELQLVDQFVKLQIQQFFIQNRLVEGLAGGV